MLRETLWRSFQYFCNHARLEADVPRCVCNLGHITASSAKQLDGFRIIAEFDADLFEDGIGRFLDFN